MSDAMHARQLIRLAEIGEDICREVGAHAHDIADGQRGRHSIGALMRAISALRQLEEFADSLPVGVREWEVMEHATRWGEAGDGI